MIPGSISLGNVTVEDSEISSGLRDQPTMAPFDVSHAPEPPVSSGLQTETPVQPAPEDRERLTPHKGAVQASPPDVPDDRENRNPIRKAVLTAARKTFETVDVVSGAVPIVGDYIGVAAKIGLAAINIVEVKRNRF